MADGAALRKRCRRAGEAASDDGGAGQVESLGVRGIVLAGVHAWGECALEELVARPLLPIAARPLIWHILRWLRDGGIHEATVCGNSVTAAFRRSLSGGAAGDTSVAYSEDTMPRGPAGCARDASLGNDAEAFLVVDGTIFPCVELTPILDAHAQAKAALTVAVSAAGKTNGRPFETQEPVGIYVFSQNVLEQVPATGYQDVKETLIPCLYRRGERIVTHLVPNGSTPRVTDAASYLALSLWAVQRVGQNVAVPPGYAPVGEAWIAPSARVDRTARLMGPVLVGPQCVIEAGAMIVGPTTIGRESRIGPEAVVSRSAVWDGCHIGATAVLDHCVLTHEATVGPGIVVRHTLRTAPRRTIGPLGTWLASHCWPARDGVRAAEYGARREPALVDRS